MVQTSYRYETITCRETTPGTIEATHARLDPSSGRMVFTHLATLIGSLAGDLEAADTLAYAAQIHSARIGQDRAVERATTPTGG